jgi:cation transport ATPase
LAALGLFAENGPLIASVAMGASSITVVIRSAMLAKTRL